MKRRIFLWGAKKEGAQSSAQPCCGKENPPEKWGPPLWEELHKRPYVFVSKSKETDWLLDNFSPRIPCNECQQHLWRHILDHHVPERAHDYAVWLVDFHNLVNAKLGKPRWHEERQPQ
jgi:hypothetical protein